MTTNKDKHARNYINLPAINNFILQKKTKQNYIEYVSPVQLVSS